MPGDDALLHHHAHLFAEPLHAVSAYFGALRRLERPLVSVEVYGHPEAAVDAFLHHLREAGLFAAPAKGSRVEECRFHGSIAASPFRTLVEVVAAVGFHDGVADLAGLLVGHTPREVAAYLKRPHVRERGLLGTWATRPP